MTPTINFPDLFPSLKFEGECFAFPVVVNGRPVKVLITAAALQRRFGAKSGSRQDLEQVITLDMPSIQALIRSFIETGQVSQSGEVIIDGAQVMKVAFGDKLRRSSYLELLVRQATQRLEEVIGASAPRVTASWDLGEDLRGHPVITLELADATESVTAQFEPWELARDSIQTQLRFIRLWGDLLQEKSHRQLQQLLAS